MNLSDAADEQWLHLRCPGVSSVGAAVALRCHLILVGEVSFRVFQDRRDEADGVPFLNDPGDPTRLDGEDENPYWGDHFRRDEAGVTAEDDPNSRGVAVCSPSDPGGQNL